MAYTGLVEPTVGIRFLVQIDDQSLGTFDSCDGLGCEVVLEQREEGGNNGFTWQLPSRLNYPNITLKRPLSTDTEKVGRWISSMTTVVVRRTGQIQAMTPAGQVIGRWGLLDVVPVRWQGPSFGPDENGVLTETVEIAHHGFIDPGQ